MGFLTGKSKQSSHSESGNKAYPFIQEKFGGLTDNATKSSDFISALLGIGGDPTAQQGAFDKYRESTGYNFKMNEGTRAITSNAAAKGLLGSGGTLKSLSKYGQGLADSTFNDYLSQLFNFGNTGFQAGNLISGAGQYSQSDQTSSSKPGLGGLIGTIAGGIATGGTSLIPSLAGGAMGGGMKLLEQNKKVI